MKKVVILAGVMVVVGLYAIGWNGVLESQTASPTAVDWDEVDQKTAMWIDNYLLTLDKDSAAYIILEDFKNKHLQDRGTTLNNNFPRYNKMWIADVWSNRFRDEVAHIAFDSTEKKENGYLLGCFPRYNRQGDTMVYTTEQDQRYEYFSFRGTKLNNARLFKFENTDDKTIYIYVVFDEENNRYWVVKAIDGFREKCLGPYEINLG